MIIVCISVVVIFFLGTFNPDTTSSRVSLYEEPKSDNVKIDSAAGTVETLFATSDTAGLAKILSPTSLAQRRQYFSDLKPYMPAFGKDFRSRKLLYATPRFAVYEFISANGRFTTEFCLGDNGQWMLMSF